MDFALDLYEYHQCLQKDGVWAIFKGAISQELLADIAEGFKERTQIPEAVKNKVFAVFIEVAQNIYHHSAEKQMAEGQTIGARIVMITQSADSFMVSGGNWVTKAQKEKLEQRTAYINHLDKEALAEYYRQERKFAKGKTQGAHVGLIDMVRRSGNPLAVRFEESPSGLYFFSISVRIEKEWKKVVPN
ncbi:SiaB family protein kinase [Hugenholtzia roseola]|uniref:SiaB family protein kinase n=1 Tax=Hugenholtzia roseola TaxID=1002 RepID=UPI0012B54592|nr:SiaB family protein kinase [Hugenholtzia roseola]